MEQQIGYWVGLDVGQSTTSVCVVDGAGDVAMEASCATATSDIISALAPYPLSDVRLIGLESGLGAHLARDLRSAGFPVRVFEARRASQFLSIRRNKTDASDARGLAELGRVARSIGSDVHVKSLEHQNIRTVLVARNRMVQQRKSVESVIRSLVRLHGGKLKVRKACGTLATDMEPLMGVLIANGLDAEAEVQPLVAIAEAMRSHLVALDKRLEAAARSHPICRLLMTVPGVGPITALSFVSAIGEPARFPRATRIGPYLGLTPILRQSGSYLRQGRISKMGCKLTRTHLVSAATSLIYRTKKASALRTWALSLNQRIGAAKARVAVARKLAVVMLAMWRSGQPFAAAGTSM